MSEPIIKRASLADIRKMKDDGDLFHDVNAPEGAPAEETLDRNFWDNATLEPPRTTAQPVLLKLEPEVLEFFKKDGKGHLTRMQNVLRAYVRAHS